MQIRDRWAIVKRIRTAWTLDARASERAATVTVVLPETPVFQAYCGHDPPRFANPVELEYAKILDWYGVPWLYEPTTFVLARDAEGRVTEAFTPDFYLPEQDLYLEVTVMKQSLVTRKNRKLRKLRAALSRDQDQAVLRARLPAAAAALRPAPGVLSPATTTASAKSSSTRHELGARVRELGAELARDYAGREPLLVGALKACIPFTCDLSRALPILHALDFVELSGYGSAETGGHDQVRFLKDLDTDIEGRHVVLVEEVVDTGLTMHYLTPVVRAAEPRVAAPRSRSSTGRTAGSSTICPCATSASRSPTSSSSATASIWTSAGGTCPDLHFVAPPPELRFPPRSFRHG